MPQGVYWLLTIPASDYTPNLPDACSYIVGQRERGSNTDYDHWQLLVAFKRSVRLAAVKSAFGRSCHAELSRSAAADSYVQKDDTAVPGTRFQLGEKPLRRNSKNDWKLVHDLARTGQFADIPHDIQVRHFGNLLRIGAYFAEPRAIVRESFLYWGSTGLGKSRDAWARAGLDAYAKSPTSKFWDGYRGQSHVVVDEFRGGISIEHILRWLDRYPVLVEVKGSSVPLLAEKIWFTSNIPIDLWYPTTDKETVAALKRRIKVTHYDAL